MGSKLRAPSNSVVDRETAEVEQAVLTECVQMYGTDLLAYLLGAGSAAPLAAWRLDAMADGDRYRLDTCYRISGLFKDSREVRAWMRRPAEAFGGHSPAWAVRYGDRDMLSRVERAAEREVDPI